jgi:RES domain-containing protein
VSVAGEVIYEVNLDVDACIEADYRAWLRDHVAQMLALPGFVDARMAEVLDPAPAPAPGRVAFCVHYRLHDEAALQAYFDHHATAMRGDGAARFGGRFSASRRVLRDA